MFLSDILKSLEERGLLVPHVKVCLSIFNIFLFSKKMEEIVCVLSWPAWTVNLKTGTALIDSICFILSVLTIRKRSVIHWSSVLQIF